MRRDEPVDNMFTIFSGIGQSLVVDGDGEDVDVDVDDVDVAVEDKDVDVDDKSLISGSDTVVE